MEYLHRRRSCLRASITRAIAAIDALLEQPVPPELDLCIQLDLFLDKQTELRALDAAIQASLVADDLMNDVATALHYDGAMCTVHARVGLASQMTPPVT